MRDFQQGKLEILVATTVMRSGGRSNATVMVIEHADRFGLAQLHQLADGSVAGRKSYCILMRSAKVRRRRTPPRRHGAVE